MSAPAYVPLDGRPWRHSMGLRPLELAHWLEFGPDAPFQLREKDRLLRERRDEVLALTDGATDACAELRDDIVANLALFHPSWPRDVDEEESPIVAASRRVPEDLCVLQRDETHWRLVAACVRFPSRWRLADKIAATLDEIHVPVPGYDASLSHPTNLFFDRLTPERGYWRLNWTLLDDPSLFQPTSGRRSPQLDPTTWMFRVERQTVRRLPRSAAAVFTIRTYVRPASELVRDHESFAGDVQRILATAPGDTLAYKGWTDLAERWADAFPTATTNTPPQ